MEGEDPGSTQQMQAKARGGHAQKSRLRKCPVFILKWDICPRDSKSEMYISILFH